MKRWQALLLRFSQNTVTHFLRLGKNLGKKGWQSFWKRPLRWSIGLVLLILYAKCLPDPLFTSPYSNILRDRNGELLSARIAEDGQWRFPPLDTVGHIFSDCITTFEDKRFAYHPGVDPIAMARAIWLNVSRGKVVSGGSTLSMQVIRLSRREQKRTFGEKLIEVILATRLEIRYTKEEILALYASHAPFGGNVVGLPAASWKYYGREPSQLSWAEMATLAVLPNAPGLIHPGRNRTALLEKRNRLLKALWEVEILDSTGYDLALLEDLPARPLPLPDVAPHLLDYMVQQHLSENEAEMQATVDRILQKRANGIVARHHAQLRLNGIHNAAALILDVNTGDALAYVGNTPCSEDNEGCRVNVIPSRRSTGSILKPFLYASMLTDGELLPHTLVADIPSYYAGYQPANYDRTYRGAVPASKALARSLNIPAVRMLQAHGIPKFHDELKRLGLTTLNRLPSDYGLSLVLGGAEASLWEVAGIYAGMARSLREFREYDARYDPHAFRAPNVQIGLSRGRIPQQKRGSLVRQSPLSAAAIWHTFEAMVEVTRPSEDAFWENFASADRIAWKTGTSFGYRDAWAVGCTPEYVVAVWVGNADGEGRPGIVGSQAAAPIMFDLFDALGGNNGWFTPPYDELSEVALCRQSGHRASSLCPQVDSAWIPETGLRTGSCPYHQLVHLSADRRWQVHGQCYSPLEMRHEAFFVLPPTQAWYYSQQQPNYEEVPPFSPQCQGNVAERQTQMEWVYPHYGARIYIPVDLDGSRSETVFKVAHRQADSQLFWHLDETYLGETREIHHLALSPGVGPHVITVVDAAGNRISRQFEVVEEGG